MWWGFVKAVVRGEHRLAPATWIAAVAAVVYAIVPLDLIPELVLGPLGIVDDLGFLGIAAVLIAREHQRWRGRREVD